MNLPEPFLPQILLALEQYAAYMHATNRDPAPYRDIADQLRQPRPGTVCRPKSKPAPPTAKMAFPQRPTSLEDRFIFRMRLDLSDL